MTELVVHHLDHSRSTRVLWLLAELGVDYELKIHQRDANMRAPEAMRKLHPLGKSPIVVHGERVLAESGAVLEYLVDEFDAEHRLRPASDDPAYLDYRYWMHYAEGSLMSPLLVRLIMDKVRTAPLPFFIKPIAKGVAGKVEETFTRPELERHAAYLNDALAERPFFAGEQFSAADIQMIYGVEALVTRGRVQTDVSRLSRWLDGCRARPAFQAALERGGPLIPD